MTKMISGGEVAVPVVTKSMRIWSREPCPPNWCGHPATKEATANSTTTAKISGAAMDIVLFATGWGRSMLEEYAIRRS